MALQVTKKDAVAAVHRLDAIKRRIANIKEQAEQTTERLLATAEVTGAAFGMGVIQGKTGGVELFGVPLELGLGLGLTAFGLLGGAGKHSGHLANVGSGCLAAYATTLGRGVGKTWASKSGSAQGQVSTSGIAPGLMAGAPLSPVEVAMAQRAAAGIP